MTFATGSTASESKNSIRKKPTMIRHPLCLHLTFLLITAASAPNSLAQTPVAAVAAVDAKQPAGIIRLDAFVRSDLPSSKAVADYLDALQKQTPGLDVHLHDVLKDRKQLAALYALSKRAGREKPVIPAFASCNRIYFGFDDAAKSGPQIVNLFTADVYTRITCPKCSAAKRFIAGLNQRWPAVRFRIFDVDTDAQARARWETLCRANGTLPGLPTIDFGGMVSIGYQGDEITGKRLEQWIQKVSPGPEEEPPPKSPRNSPGTPPLGMRPYHSHTTLAGSLAIVSAAQLPFTLTMLQTSDLSDDLSDDTLEFDLPEEASEEDMGAATIEGSQEPNAAPESIDLPIFGKLRVNDLGMPLFTLAVGLVDGFNPCAMWILVFLLSVLVNIKDRRKILLIAGTFVVVSGLAYFAFMAAWLNLFMLIGIVRPVQIALGLLALFIGLVNVKDFFAFKKGLSLSIPESQKPGLYRRVREIVNAKYLSVALGGAIVLAVIVNMIELLCTAGLPALYTQILSLQEFPPWKNYAYLALYIAAYMFDDALLVGIVVATLSHRKLQEREGRWLKLISGLVILALGIVMLFKPQWLQWE